MKIIIVVAVLTSILLFGCKNADTQQRNPYNFSLIYDYTHPVEREDKYRSKFSENKLYLFIESDFNNDTISLKIDKRDEIINIVKTEPSSGLAKVIEIDNIESISRVYFSINNSPIISFEIFDKKNNLIGVKKDKEEVDLVFYKRVPIFD